MTDERVLDEPFVEQKRLEGAINTARWLGAALAFFLGPLFPNLGLAHVAVLGGFLLVYAIGIRRLWDRARTPATHFRVSQVAFTLDHAVVIYAMLIFSKDPGWTTFVVGVLVIIAGAFRFGSLGAMLSAAILAVAYAAIAFYRDVTFAFPFEPHRIVFHIAVYFVTALLVGGILRELHALRAQRETLLRHASEAEALRQADRFKREFLSAVSHDFRTPLTVVRGAIELILGERPGALTQGQRDLAESAARNVRRLEEFTEELLEVARLEEGKVALEQERLEPAALLSEVVADHGVLASQKGQRIVLDVDGAPPAIVADRLRIRQAIANLVVNAIRYAPKGSDIGVSASGDAAAFRVAVRDHGPGVPSEERARMFDTFFRGRSSAGTVGSGLGLAIARSLVMLHGGTLSYEETPGGGSTFVITMPAGGTSSEPDGRAL